MKFKSTKKAVMNSNSHVICVGNGMLQYLLMLETPVAYTARAEGVASEIYLFNGDAISTGNAPFGNVKPSSEVIKKYEDEAKDIHETCVGTYELKCIMMKRLIKQFISEVTGV